ncbi:hypothetical protein C8263_17045 [Deinococcus arcticus]|uniref:Uncharacterized protein n=2 Tax=Deinococcus arcticus TaxID=2136176 RepID=A0A2T3W3Y2_9DEIO|nr:hypothetical protein C8263_17045 [Deinococcus arcticus]
MVDRELWDIFVTCYSAYHEGAEPSFNTALANRFSGEHPEARSLDDVYDQLNRQTEALADLRAMVHETVERQEREMGELRDMLTEFRKVVQDGFGLLQTQGFAKVLRELSAADERSEGRATALDQSLTQHAADLHRALASNHSDMQRTLDAQVAQLDNLKEGVCAVAEVVSTMADHFPEPQAGSSG